MKRLRQLLETFDTLEHMNAAIAQPLEEDTFGKGYYMGKANAYELAYYWLKEELEELETADNDSQ
jgi:hypothetical protein